MHDCHPTGAATARELLRGRPRPGSPPLPAPTGRGTSPKASGCGRRRLAKPRKLKSKLSWAATALFRTRPLAQLISQRIARSLVDFDALLRHIQDRRSNTPQKTSQDGKLDAKLVATILTYCSARRMLARLLAWPIWQSPCAFLLVRRALTKQGVRQIAESDVIRWG